MIVGDPAVLMIVLIIVLAVLGAFLKMLPGIVRIILFLMRTRGK